MMDFAVLQGALRRSLHEISTLLDGVAELHWASKTNVQAVAPTIDVAEVLSWFGGMGSITDLFITRANGHRVEKEHERRLNEHLDQLRDDLYHIASSMKSAAERP